LIHEKFRSATAEMGPNPFLSRLEPFLPKPADAVEWGAGRGRASRRLAGLGWRVWAVERDPAMISDLLGDARIRTVPMDLRSWTPPPHRLSLFLFSLFYLPAEDQAAAVRKAALRVEPGGILAGQLLLERDDWARSGEMHAAGPEILPSWPVRLIWDEAEREGRTAWGEPKRWHILHFALRAPAPDGPI
jgi:hypothetical protein